MTHSLHKSHHAPWRRSGEDDAWCQVELTPSMTPFLMALTSPSDHWGFISSTGGLTLGRVAAERAIFPYETDDRLHRGHRLAGPQTRLLVARGGAEQSVDPWHHPDAERRLLKHRFGHQLVFQSRLPELGLTFAYRWAPSAEFGWVRTCWLLCDEGTSPLAVTIQDGLRGLMAPNVVLSTYQSASCLVDAYRRAELVGSDSAALITLESQVSDRPEPKESLRANMVFSSWSEGVEPMLWDLDPRRVGQSAGGEAETLRLGRPAGYAMEARASLSAEQPCVSWHQVIDVHLDHAEVVARLEQLRGGVYTAAIDDSLTQTTEALSQFVEALDGHQLSADSAADTRHTMSALFNGMRGGLPLGATHIDQDDFARYVLSRCPRAHRRLSEQSRAPAESATRDTFIASIESLGDTDLIRLAMEYLPLSWGRRHGGPSRPWNRFSIHLTDEKGAPRLHYEGNWRDIFQNWEALAWSYPSFAESILARFVGASSADGFNPYRISRDGVDWEVPEPDNPWAHIGYWGDHQGPYLCRLVELYRGLWPERARGTAQLKRYAYVDIPYRLASHEEMVKNPKQTLRFDHQRHEDITSALSSRGEDGRLLACADAQVVHVSLVEKLLVAALGRMGQLVAGGGIWMSTQRPEWNDANNALAGDGLSLVSTAYLHRFLGEIEALLMSLGTEVLSLSDSVSTWLDETTSAYASLAAHDAPADLDSAQRRALLDAVALPYERHRTRVYEGRLGSTTQLPLERGLLLCRLGREACAATLLSARREDGLFDAYRVMTREAEGGIGIGALPLMLEGQVAALSSGLLSATQACDVIEALFESGLYRADQKSFTLMVPRPRPGFLDINCVDISRLSPGLLKAANDAQIIIKDTGDHWRFHPDCQSQAELQETLDRTTWPESWRVEVLTCFEHTFGHQTFLGRSGTMYGYEGIGCIYWHMVAKLLVATQEVALRAQRQGEDAAVLDRIRGLYHRVRDGLGFRRSAESYGAFPTDPYSHTPTGRGAQQPGMTGLVKEDIISRYGELGVRVEQGELVFDPTLLSADDFLSQAATFRGIPCPIGSLAFTLAGVPVVYRLAETARVEIQDEQGLTQTWTGHRLPVAVTRRWLSRSAHIEVAWVDLDASRLFKASHVG